VDRHPFGETPWFEDDAPDGPWVSVYELIADVSLKHKLTDPRWVHLRTTALALAASVGGQIFDIQEWRTIEQ
jgi:hypothetical protein